MSDFLLVPLEDSVVFPNMTVTLAVETGDEQRVLLVPVHEGEYARVGTVAEVGGVLRLPGGGHAVTLNGLHRGIAGAASTGAASTGTTARSSSTGVAVRSGSSTRGHAA